MEDPINVVIPARIAVNDSGISSALGPIEKRRAMSMLRLGRGGRENMADVEDAEVAIPARNERGRSMSMLRLG